MRGRQIEEQRTPHGAANPPQGLRDLTRRIGSAVGNLVTGQGARAQGGLFGSTVETRAAREAEREQAALTQEPLATEPGTPLVSVILATRNRAALTAQAIASVQAQVLTNWELIVVNDGSTDETAAVLDALVAGPSPDARIRIIHLPHGGVSAARNKGLAAARGKFVAFLDSDNLLYPAFLAAAARVLAADGQLPAVYGALVTEVHAGPAPTVFLHQFSRSELERGNYIDCNAVLWRRADLDRIGGFDEDMDRLVDWDLALRMTCERAAQPLDVLAAQYRVLDDQRISLRASYGRNLLKLQRKLPPAPATARPLKVLYALWHYPQLSETYLETELRAMRRWGADIAVWRETVPVSPYPSDVPVHSGRLEDAIRDVRPDVIHVHWLDIAVKYAGALGAAGVPVTVRGHGFDVSPAAIRKLLGFPWVRAIYLAPHQAALVRRNPRVRPAMVPFDTELFKPREDKDRRLVVRTAAGLNAKDLGLFFELAARLPDYRFVLAAVTCNLREEYIGTLREMNAQSGGAAQIVVDMPRDAVADLVGRAGIYLHTVTPPGKAPGTPIGSPVSIAEAMATGAVPLVRKLPELTSYVGDAGLAYADIDDAQRLLTAMAQWSDADWRRHWNRAVERAFTHHADIIAVRQIYEDWAAVLADQAKAS